MNKKNIRKIAVAGTTLVALLCSNPIVLHAANATIGTGIDGTNYLALANGNFLPTGDLVQMGSFTGITDLQLQQLASGNTLTPANYATLLADFVPLNANGSTTIGTGTTDSGNGFPNGYPGTLAFTFTGNNPTFASTPIYLIAFNSSTTGTATQVGVFRWPSITAQEYPADMQAGTPTIDFDTIQPPLIGTTQSGLTNPYDTIQNGNDPGLDVAFRLDSIVSVPEPSTVALVGMGLLGAFTFRRRSKKA